MMFSYIEYKEVNSNNTFDNFLSYGGIPFVTIVSENIEVKTKILKDIFDSVILKDIIARNNIRDVTLLEKLIRYILTHIGK